MKAAIWNFSEWINETDSVLLKEKFNKMLLDSGFEIVNFMEHYFDPIGYTAIWLIAESHFAIHTFPEHNKAYIDLSSCSEEKQNKFIKLFNDK